MQDSRRFLSGKHLLHILQYAREQTVPGVVSSMLVVSAWHLCVRLVKFGGTGSLVLLVVHESKLSEIDIETG